MRCQGWFEGSFPTGFDDAELLGHNASDTWGKELQYRETYGTCIDLGKDCGSKMERRNAS